MQSTWNDIRDALRWTVASGVLLAPSGAGGLDVEGSAPMPEPVRFTLFERAGTIAKLLAVTGSPALVAQLAVYWELERRLQDDDGRAALEELAEERAAIREHDGGMDADTAEICALGDVARILLARSTIPAPVAKLEAA